VNTTFWLCFTIVAAGLWSGLLLTITTILHPMFASQPAEGMRHDLGRFLPIARRSPTNYILVVALMIAPIVTLFALWDSSVDAPFVLTAAGATLTLTGAFGISRFAAEPNYDVILADDTPSSPQRWATARHRYFLLNWVRAGFTWAALACFVSAAYLHWT
jgi:hypothetical protein